MKEPSRIGTFENAGAVLVRGKPRGEFVKSLLIASLENIVKYDADADLRAACRARYLDLTGRDISS
jgi:hypothetical protein